MVLVRYE